ncbi:flagellar hook-length control protein FliK [Pseudoroseicyclus sp. H15]
MDRIGARFSESGAPMTFAFIQTGPAAMTRGPGSSDPRKGAEEPAETGERFAGIYAGEPGEEIEVSPAAPESSGEGEAEGEVFEDVDALIAGAEQTLKDKLVEPGRRFVWQGDGGFGRQEEATAVQGQLAPDDALLKGELASVLLAASSDVPGELPVAVDDDRRNDPLSLRMLGNPLGETTRAQPVELWREARPFQPIATAASAMMASAGQQTAAPSTVPPTETPLTHPVLRIDEALPSNSPVLPAPLALGARGVGVAAATASGGANEPSAELSPVLSDERRLSRGESEKVLAPRVDAAPRQSVENAAKNSQTPVPSDTPAGTSTAAAALSATGESPLSPSPMPRGEPGLPAMGEIGLAGPSQPASASANAAAVVTPTGAREIVVQMSAALPQTPGERVEIRLSPEELGHLRMVLHSHDGSMVLQISADRQDTADLLRRHAAELTREMQELGYAEVSLEFASGEGDGPGSGAQGQGAFDAPAAAPGRDVAESHTGRQPAAGLDLRL